MAETIKELVDPDKAMSDAATAELAKYCPHLALHHKSGVCGLKQQIPSGRIFVAYPRDGQKDHELCSPICAYLSKEVAVYKPVDCPVNDVVGIDTENVNFQKCPLRDHKITRKEQ